MSRLLKQVYSQNIYVEFRFESSLRKYDKKPTKKLKCEAFCKHCINHHRMSECSPSRQSKIKFQSHGKLKRFGEHSIQKPSEKSVISPCKTIKLSKQKPPLSQSKEINALQMNIYRGLQERKSENAVLQKSQEDNSSSMEDEIFFNQFVHDVIEQENKEISIDQDFVKIEISEKNISSQQKQQEIEIENQKQENQSSEFQQVVDQNEEQKQLESLVAQNCEEKEQILSAPLPEDNNSQKQQRVSLVQEHAQAIVEEFNQNKSQLADRIEQSLPIQLQTNLLGQNTQPNDEEHQQNLQNIPQIIEESCLGESMMDKCLAFQGGRIYVDTSGQNFYISVRVFNKLRRRYSDIEQLTNVLIHQRPYLQSRKGQIKQELEQYLRTYI